MNWGGKESAERPISIYAVFYAKEEEEWLGQRVEQVGVKHP